MTKLQANNNNVINSKQEEENKILIQLSTSQIAYYKILNLLKCKRKLLKYNNSLKLQYFEVEKNKIIDSFNVKQIHQKMNKIENIKSLLFADENSQAVFDLLYYYNNAGSSSTGYNFEIITTITSKENKMKIEKLKLKEDKTEIENRLLDQIIKIYTQIEMK